MLFFLVVGLENPPWYIRRAMIEHAHTVRVEQWAPRPEAGIFRFGAGCRCSTCLGRVGTRGLSRTELLQEGPARRPC